jgi:hypothetical protein
MPKRVFTGHHLDVRSTLRFRRPAQSQLGSLPATLWPYAPYYIDSTPTEASPSVSETLPEPQIIILSDASHARPERATPETRPDFGYVAGCRAIPNGYHCDSPRDETAP